MRENDLVGENEVGECARQFRIVRLRGHRGVRSLRHHETVVVIR